MTWVTDISTASTFKNGENNATQELRDLSDYLSELGGRSPSRWTGRDAGWTFKEERKWLRFQ
jgi:hypothetical protein